MSKQINILIFFLLIVVSTFGQFPIQKRMKLLGKCTYEIYLKKYYGKYMTQRKMNKYRNVFFNSNIKTITLYHQGCCGDKDVYYFTKDGILDSVVNYNISNDSVLRDINSFIGLENYFSKAYYINGFIRNHTGWIGGRRFIVDIYGLDSTRGYFAFNLKSAKK